MAFRQNNPLSRKTSPINKNWIKGAIKRPEAFKKKAEDKITKDIKDSKNLIDIYNNLSNEKKLSIREQLLSKSYFADYIESEDVFELSEMMINFAKYQNNLLYIF